MRVLVLGASGLLGNAVFRGLNERKDWVVFGTLRTRNLEGLFLPSLKSNLVFGVDVLSQDSMVNVLEQTHPDVIINCVSLAKPLLGAGNPIDLIPIFALLPHRLAALCKIFSARLIHISTDGVFSGSKGQYSEYDVPDAKDLYGLSKYLGEISGAHTVTLRTSMIGHGLQNANGLLDWFLSQKRSCRCFTRAIFSGLPTVVLAQIIRDVIIPKLDLSGIYHVAAKPISKFDLLHLVAEEYGKSIELIPVDQPVVDRSLNSDRFRAATGYVAPDWPTLIRVMHSHQ